MSEKMIVACPECETRFVAPREKFLPDGRKVRCAKCGHSWFQRLEGADLPSAEAPAETPSPAPAQSIMDRAAQATAAHPNARMPSSEPSARPTVDAGRESAVDAETDAADAVGESSNYGSAVATATAAVAGAGVGAAGSLSSARAEDLDRIDVESDESQPISMNEPRRKRSFWPRAILYSLAAAIVAGALGYFFKDEIASAVPALDPPLTSWKATVDGVVSTAVPSNRALKIENVKYDLSESGDEPAMLLSADVANESGSAEKTPKLTATIFGADGAVLKSVSVSPEDPVTEIAAQTSQTYFLRLPYPPEGLERVEVDFAE